jgi:hypothetical protein
MPDLIPAAAPRPAPEVPGDGEATGRTAADSELVSLASLAAAVTGDLTEHAAARGLDALATLPAVTGALAVLAGGLPRLCRELSGWLGDQFTAGRLAPVDDGRPAAVLAARAWYQMEAAITAAEQLTAALAAAETVTGALRRPAGEDR